MEPARPFEQLDFPTPGDSPLGPPYYYPPSPRKKFQDRVWLHVALFLLTIVTTTYAGAGWWFGFASDFGNRTVTQTGLDLFVRGLWYGATVIAILGCHELGHYFACRYYDVDASLPYFLPIPISFSGTLGAFIKIREPIPSKRMLFDIGIAGPIAGFAVAVPALVIGMAMSRVVPVPPNTPGWEFGDPLAFKIVSALFFGHPPDGYALNLHPIAWGAWFGFFATALNLFPIGQLDGGHICYAVIGRRSSYVTMAMICVAAVLVFVSVSWAAWTVMMIAMLFMFGRHHPRTVDEHVPLDRTRLALAIFAVVMFALSFTPNPVQIVDVIKH